MAGALFLYDAKPTMFFAPGHFKKRDAELGEGQMLMRGMMAGIEISKALEGMMNIEWLNNGEALQQLWLDLLANKVDPKTGIMVNLNGE